MEVEGEQHLEENGDNDYEEEDVWLGDCMFEDRNNQEKYFRSFTRSKGSLELFSVEVGSFVYINNFIGLVCCFWEKDSQKQVEVRNIYRPHQTIEGIQPYHGNAEVLLSLIVTEHSTSLIQGLCSVSVLEEYYKKKNFDLDTYYYNQLEYCDLPSPSSSSSFINTFPLTLNVISLLHKPTNKQLKSKLPPALLLPSSSSSSSSSTKPSTKLSPPKTSSSSSFPSSSSSSPLTSPKKRIHLIIDDDDDDNNNDDTSNPLPSLDVNNYNNILNVNKSNRNNNSRKSNNNNNGVVKRDQKKNDVLIEFSKDDDDNNNVNDDDDDDNNIDSFGEDDQNDDFIPKSLVHFPFNNNNNDNNNNNNNNNNNEENKVRVGKTSRDLFTLANLNKSPIKTSSHLHSFSSRPSSGPNVTDRLKKNIIALKEEKYANVDPSKLSWIERMESGEKIKEIKHEASPLKISPRSVYKTDIKDLLLQVKERSSPLKSSLKSPLKSNNNNNNENDDNNDPFSSLGTHQLQKSFPSPSSKKKITIDLDDDDDDDNDNTFNEREKQKEKQKEKEKEKEKERENERKKEKEKEKEKEEEERGTRLKRLKRVRDAEDDSKKDQPKKKQTLLTFQFEDEFDKRYSTTTTTTTPLPTSTSKSTRRNSPSNALPLPLPKRGRKTAANKYSSVILNDSKDDDDDDFSNVLSHVRSSTRRRYGRSNNRSRDDDDDDEKEGGGGGNDLDEYLELDDFVVPNDVIEYVSDQGDDGEEGEGGGEIRYDKDLSSLPSRHRHRSSSSSLSSPPSSSPSSSLSISFIPGNLRDYTLKDAFGIYTQYLLGTIAEEGFVQSLTGQSLHYFQPAIQKVERTICDRKELMVSSSVWEPHFRTVLLSFPIFESFPVTSHMDCEACCRSNHPATYLVKLKGKQYDHLRLWKKSHLLIIKGNEDENLESEKREFHLGRFCFQRSSLFHKLHHYKYVLLYQLREKLKNIDNTMDVSEILDHLDTSGWLDRKFSSLKSLLHEVEDFKDSFASKGTG